ncbi:MAG: hypothetical protein RLN81_13810 [Balneolaceae bacterium]
MAAEELPHEWSTEALFAKAQRNAEKMLAQSKEEWTFGFWSALTLEMLLRATLSNISPTLIADNKSWYDLYYSLGFEPITKKYTPKSISISEVIKRLESISDEFTGEEKNYCISHMELRNSEVHSGDLPFDKLNHSEWLGKFYSVCKILLAIKGLVLDDLFGTDEATTAETLIDAYHDKSAKAVIGTIEAHKEVWEGKGDEDKETLAKQAETWASRNEGHRLNCPSCNSKALVFGNSIGTISKTIDEDTITEKQNYLPSHFECVACGLKINGYSKLNACGLGDTFTATNIYDAFEYYESENYDKYHDWEPDYNE